MKVVDSSIWIELLSNGPLAEIARRALANPREVVIPSIVVLEVYKVALRLADERTADQILSRMMLSPLRSLTPVLSVRAAELCSAHGLATADAIILAHAQMERLPLVTCDRHFEGLERAEYHPKTAAT